MRVSEMVYCRFCAEQTSVIFDYTKITCLRDDIVKILSFLDLKWFDISAKHLPETVCKRCYHSLTNAYEFITKIKTSQAVLTNLLTNLKQENESDHCENPFIIKRETIYEDSIHNNFMPDNEGTKLCSELLRVSLVEEDMTWNSYHWSCKDCGMVFENINKIREHSKEVHEKCSNFQCADCSAIFNCFDSFVDHARGHRPGLNNYCQYCNIKVEPETDHVSLHKAQPQCHACGELFKLKTSLQKHIYTYQSQKRKKKSLKVPALVSDDVGFVDEDIHVQSWSDYPWICQYCDLKVQDQTSLRSHYKDVHIKCSAMRCYDCYEDGSETFFDYNKFFGHVRMHRPNLKSQCHYCNYFGDNAIQSIETCSATHNNRPQCEVCGEFFQDITELQNHKAFFNLPKPTNIPNEAHKTRKKSVNPDESTCTICNKEMKNSNYLKIHMKWHNIKKEFFCEKCGKSFASLYTLAAHNQTHTERDRQTCKICNKTFVNLIGLRKHIKIHDDKKPFECDLCHRCFRAKRNLIEHMIVHTDLFPYNCPYCDKKFKFKTVLNNHIVIHTGARPFVCTYCNRDFTNIANCNKHMKRKHGTTLAKSRNKPNAIKNVNSMKTDEDVKKWTEEIMSKRNRKAFRRATVEGKVELRTQIVELYQKGVNKCEISRKLNVSRKTINLWINRYRECGNLKDLCDVPTTGSVGTGEH